jgi:hypothetical protein
LKLQPPGEDDSPGGFLFVVPSRDWRDGVTHGQRHPWSAAFAQLHCPHGIEPQDNPKLFSLIALKRDESRAPMQISFSSTCF